MYRLTVDGFVSPQPKQPKASLPPGIVVIRAPIESQARQLLVLRLLSDFYVLSVTNAPAPSALHHRRAPPFHLLAKCHDCRAMQQSDHRHTYFALHKKSKSC